MHNKWFFFSVVLFTGSVIANNNNDQLAVSLAKAGTELYAAHQQYQQSLPNEKNFRRKIYWLDKNNPNWYMLSDYQKDFDYHIANLVAHIKVLEDKVVQKKNGLQSAALIRGFIVSALSGLCGYGAYVCRQQGKLAQADIMTSKWVRNIGSQHAMDGVVYLGIIATILAAVAAQNFDKAYRYAERVLERLERDKRILALLENEKAAKLSAKDNVSEAALELINSLVGVITKFSQPTEITPVAVIPVVTESLTTDVTSAQSADVVSEDVILEVVQA